MIAAYPALLRRLYAARRFGVILGLDRMRALLARLGDPALGTIVHVGGTNGKGSTVAMIAAMARPLGRVATYTSPHLTSVRERITIDGQMIDEHALVAAADRVYAAGGDEFTFFEQLTAIAAVAIASARVDVTVLEVGLGGRLDATTAIAGAEIAVVTGVAMDHEAILGHTLGEIAREKAGIFKPGQRVVIGASGEPAAVPILVEAARIATSVTVIDAAAIARVPAVGLAGEHQRANAAAAIAAVTLLAELAGANADAGRIDAASIATALATVQHPGRFEIVPLAGGRTVIIDGAHNPHGAAALVATLREHAIDARATALIVAVSSDKDTAGIARALAPAAARVIATRYQQDRGLPPAELAAAFAACGVAADVVPDLASALAASAGATTIVIAGSLFLAGEARVLLLGAPADPIAVSDPAAISSAAP